MNIVEINGIQINIDEKATTSILDGIVCDFMCVCVFFFQLNYICSTLFVVKFKIKSYFSFSYNPAHGFERFDRCTVRCLYLSLFEPLLHLISLFNIKYGLTLNRCMCVSVCVCECGCVYVCWANDWLRLFGFQYFRCSFLGSVLLGVAFGKFYIRLATACYDW